MSCGTTLPTAEGTDGQRHLTVYVLGQHRTGWDADACHRLVAAAVARRPRPRGDPPRRRRPAPGAWRLLRGDDTRGRPGPPPRLQRQPSRAIAPDALQPGLPRGPRRDDRDAALATSRRAVAAGFDDAEQMRPGPGPGLPGRGRRPRALVTDLTARLTLLASERGLRLEPETAGAGRAAPRRRPESGLLPPAPATHLARRRPGHRPGERFPLAGRRAVRPRLVVTLGLPDADTPYLSRNAFVFAFGTDAKGGGWGAFWVPTLGRWQPVAELAPRFDQDGAPVRLAIPWSLIQPLHPLVDPVLGFNATLLGAAARHPAPTPSPSSPTRGLLPRGGRPPRGAPGLRTPTPGPGRPSWAACDAQHRPRRRAGLRADRGRPRPPARAR